MPTYTTIVTKNSEYNTLQYSTEIIASGELVVATDSGVLKVGDGLTAWSGLPSVGVPSNPFGTTGASGILNMVKITQTNYNAISSPDPNTLYFII